MLLLRLVLVILGAINGFLWVGYVSKHGEAESTALSAVAMCVFFGLALVLWRGQQLKKSPTGRLDPTMFVIVAGAGALAVILAVVPLVSQASDVGSASVRISGTTSGDGYSLESSATIESDKYHETILSLQAVNEGTSDFTPELTAEVVESDGYINNCSTARSWRWSYGQGQASTLELQCLLFMSPEELKGITDVRVSER